MSSSRTKHVVLILLNTVSLCILDRIVLVLTPHQEFRESPRDSSDANEEWCYHHVPKRDCISISFISIVPNLYGLPRCPSARLPTKEAGTEEEDAATAGTEAENVTIAGTEEDTDSPEVIRKTVISTCS